MVTFVSCNNDDKKPAQKDQGEEKEEKITGSEKFISFMRITNGLEKDIKKCTDGDQFCELVDKFEEKMSKEFDNIEDLLSSLSEKEQEKVDKKLNELVKLFEDKQDELDCDCSVSAEYDLKMSAINECKKKLNDCDDMDDVEDCWENFRDSWDEVDDAIVSVGIATCSDRERNKLDNAYQELLMLKERIEGKVGY